MKAIIPDHIISFFPAILCVIKKPVTNRSYEHESLIQPSKNERFGCTFLSLDLLLFKAPLYDSSFLSTLLLGKSKHSSTLRHFGIMPTILGLIL